MRADELAATLVLPVWLCGQICATVAEVLVLATTWHAAIGVTLTAYRLDISLPITTIILRDGESLNIVEVMKLRDPFVHL